MPGQGVSKLMTEEASKTKRHRDEDFFRRYLSGRVIDIGCGNDLVVPHAEPFDRPDGDAQNILKSRDAASYDSVHSSHCLEHMADVPSALNQWYALLKPGGYLIVVVPDEDLYEQGVFPSIFNDDHKATFRLDKENSWCEHSHDIRRLVNGLEKAEIISIERQAAGYDHSLVRSGFGWWGRELHRINHRLQKRMRRYNVSSDRRDRFLNRWFFKLGAPVDQTFGPALAQIQVVVRRTE